MKIHCYTHTYLTHNFLYIFAYINKPKYIHIYILTYIPTHTSIDRYKHTYTHK